MQKWFETIWFKRVTEILPGALTWLAILLPIALSFFMPVWVAIFVVIFDLMWLVKSIDFTRGVLSTYFVMKDEQKKDWNKELVELDKLGRNSNEIWQAIILVTYKEPYEVLRTSIESYVKADFPAQRKIMIFAAEERDAENAKNHFLKLKKEFGSGFAIFEMTVHPDGIPGEIRCKSANTTWGGRQLQKILDERKISYEHVLISNFDADTRVHPQYFANLTYKFLTVPDPLHTSFQPIHIYNNNIWDVPALIRLVAFGSSFVLMSDCQKPKRFRNFSSRSNCFKTIVDINFWCVDAIPEDSRQYYDSLFAFGGKHPVVPLLTPVYMDAAFASTYWGTFKNQYLQLRRWAWGCTDIPYLIKKSLGNKSLSPWFKFKHIFHLLEWHFSWATAPIFITFVGWFPLLLHPTFRDTVLGYSFPGITGTILTISTLGLLASIVISLLMLPPKPSQYPKSKWANMILGWLLFPVMSIILSSFPAIDAQTRLMLGKYMEYRVTEKAVAPKTKPALSTSV